MKNWTSKGNFVHTLLYFLPKNYFIPPIQLIKLLKAYTTSGGGYDFSRKFTVYICKCTHVQNINVFVELDDPVEQMVKEGSISFTPTGEGVVGKPLNSVSILEEISQEEDSNDTAPSPATDSNPGTR